MTCFATASAASKLDSDPEVKHPVTARFGRFALEFANEQLPVGGPSRDVLGHRHLDVFARTGSAAQNGLHPVDGRVRHDHFQLHAPTPKTT